ncbi:protein phosphatase regulator, partial [Coemansia sp. RSA 2603]
MENTRLLVDVLLLPECNIYERYPELVQRVDYFLYNWTEEMLARTEALLRRQARALQSCPDDAFTHARSVNIAWRQFAVGRLGLPPYPPERINWNKDADPVFLYGQMPALRTHVPWSSHALRILRTPHRPADPQLKPVLKHTDLQTFLTSPTLSPLSSPSFSPVASPALSIRACTSSSSLSSANTLDADPPSTLRPRLRFNDHVEQCMVVFDQEKEYLPTDAEDASDDDARRLRSASRRKPRARRSLVIRLASAHLKGDHRKVLSVSAASPRGPGHYFNSDDEDDYDDEDPFADLPLYRSAAADSSSSSSQCPPSEDAHKQASRRGVSGYVQGCVESVAGQVRKLVSSTYAARPSPSAEVVADPYAASLATPVRSQQQQFYRQQQPLPADVVRDPFASS